jgi:saccharopine dehydrogenase-like NADP-dependent oxidoreductase
MHGRVLLLGAGGTGVMAARALSHFDAVTGLIVADPDRNAAARTALACRADAEATVVDATDHAALVGLLGRADVVLNCLAPASRFGLPVLRAAIEAGTDVLDLCDDPVAACDMLDCDAEARRADVTAVVGMGASPGVSSMLAACVASRLDTVERLVVGWNVEEGTDAPLPFAADAAYWIRQCTGAIPECRDGALAEGAPLSDLPIAYPGRGRRVLYSVGHPEAVTFHYSWPEVREARCGLVMPAAWIGPLRKLREEVDAGAMPVEQAGRRLAAWATGEAWIEDMVASLTHLVDGPRLPHCFVLGEGVRDGEKRTVAASLAATPPDAASLAGVPLALGALLHLRGQTPGPGVMAPERAFEPEAFFRLFAPYCTLPGPCPANRLIAMAEAETAQAATHKQRDKKRKLSLTAPSQ